MRNILRRVGGVLLLLAMLVFIATLGNWAWLAMVDKGLYDAIWPNHYYRRH